MARPPVHASGRPAGPTAQCGSSRTRRPHEPQRQPSQPWLPPGTRRASPRNAGAAISHCAREGA
eukprot:1399680-Pyramimonas_sp.AAC.1